jgi:hypothetical protein
VSDANKYEDEDRGENEDRDEDRDTGLYEWNFDTPKGYRTILLRRDEMRSMSEPGQNADEACKAARQLPYIREQLDYLTPQDYQEMLGGEGADWHPLTDPVQDNEDRVLWLAACGLREEWRQIESLAAYRSIEELSEEAPKPYFYKAVNFDKTRLYSWAMAVHEPVTYGPGIESRPRPGCGPLAVFGSAYAATKFMEGNGGRFRLPGATRGELILKCEITISDERALYFAHGERLTELPFGTHLASCVRGIAILTPDELPEHMASYKRDLYHQDYETYLRELELELKKEAEAANEGTIGDTAEGEGK